MHLSGWAEEWVLWATTEFGFLELPDAFCTGSSIMPHKKNPDVLELIRAKAARVAGGLQHLLMLVKGLPLAYNRDLQEDKVPLFDAQDAVMASLEMAQAIVSETRFRADAIAERIDAGYLDATTLMEHLVSRGMPMRAAHEAVGKLVRLGEERHCRLAELPRETFESIYPGLGSTVYQVLGAANAVSAFQSAGPRPLTKSPPRWQLGERGSTLSRIDAGTWTTFTTTIGSCIAKRSRSPTSPMSTVRRFLFTASARCFIT